MQIPFKRSCGVEWRGVSDVIPVTLYLVFVFSFQNMLVWVFPKLLFYWGFLVQQSLEWSLNDTSGDSMIKALGYWSESNRFKPQHNFTSVGPLANNKKKLPQELSGLMADPVLCTPASQQATICKKRISLYYNVYVTNKGKKKKKLQKSVKNKNSLICICTGYRYLGFSQFSAALD